MAYTYEVPEVGEGVVEVEITEWKVSVGDAVTRDQPLCEVTTDKASLEISSPVDGVLSERFAEEGDIVAVHTPLAVFDTDGATGTAPAAPSSPAAEALTAVVPPPPGAGVRAAPAVRRRAQELGVDLQGITGTGPGGRVVHADVERAAAAPAATTPNLSTSAAAPARKGASSPPSARPAQAFKAPPPASTAADRRIPIRGVRRKIFERMQEAKRTAPHFTYVEEVDATRLVDLRAQLKPLAAARGVRLTYLPFFARACSIAFRDFPEVNSTVDEEAFEVVEHGAHHLGFACDTPNGLVVPVVRDVQARSILDLAAVLDDLFTRAKAGKCTLQELSGSTFTITGVGSIGGVMATPILNRPEVAILGTNTIRKQPVVVGDDDRIEVRSMTYLSNSFDHRIIDGAMGARFTARVKQLLEQPAALLLEDA